MERIKRILVVDDEPEAVNSLLRHLWREGFETDSAFDGLEARSKLVEASLRGAPFNLLILDVLMPRMNGIELFKWVKEYYPLTSAIFISAFGDTDAIRANIRCGFDDFGQKPFTPRKMMQLIESIQEVRTTLRNEPCYS
ncbi:MAG: response regulator [Syntrophobacteraceae bacterium]|nr:response regulator [Syntrophobacteraceae bacterium]